MKLKQKARNIERTLKAIIRSTLRLKEVRPRLQLHSIVRLSREPEQALRLRLRQLHVQYAVWRPDEHASTLTTCGRKEIADEIAANTALKHQSCSSVADTRFDDTHPSGIGLSLRGYGRDVPAPKVRANDIS